MDGQVNVISLLLGRRMACCTFVTKLESVMLASLWSLLYVSSIIETPPEIIKQMEKMIYNFLWKGPDKVTRLSVINTLQNGGLNLTDLELHIKALRLSWIPRLLDETEGPWISYLKYNLKKYGGCFLFRCNYDVNNIDLSLTKFYLQLLR